MKSIAVYIILIFAVFTSCKKEEEKINEVPDDIIRVKMDTILYPRIKELFPDESNSVNNLPFLFTDTVQKRIVLTKESEVYIIFIAEGALYKNTLGWYSYQYSEPPTTESEIEKNIAFSNLSAVGYGGLLKEGDMVKLGTDKFPAGTVISFFLISDGWKDGVIDYSQPTYYTDYNFNLNTHQQHVLFREKKGGSLVLAFEDQSFSDADKDYNDILLNVTDNKDGFKIISFDLEKIPEL